MTIRTTSTLATVVFLATSCAYSPKHYVAPPVAPVHKSISSAQQHVMTAQKSAGLVGTALTQLEQLTRKDSQEHKLVVESQQDMDTLGRELFSTQKDLIDAQDKIDVLQDEVQVQTDKLNVDEQKLAELKPKPHFSVFAIFANIVSFVLNPLGWLVGKTVNIVIGLAVCVALFTLAAYLYRWWRRRALTPPK